MGLSNWAVITGEICRQVFLSDSEDEKEEKKLKPKKKRAKFSGYGVLLINTLFESSSILAKLESLS